MTPCDISIRQHKKTLPKQIPNKSQFRFLSWSYPELTGSGTSNIISGALFLSCPAGLWVQDVLKMMFFVLLVTVSKYRTLRRHEEYDLSWNVTYRQSNFDLSILEKNIQFLSTVCPPLFSCILLMETMWRHYSCPFWFEKWPFRSLSTNPTWFFGNLGCTLMELMTRHEGRKRLLR